MLLMKYIMKILERKHLIWPWAAEVTEEEYLAFRNYCELVNIQDQIRWTSAQAVGAWKRFPLDAKELIIFKDFMKAYEDAHS